MGKYITELLPTNFASAVHMRTGSVQAVGESEFTIAALIRPFRDLNAELPIFGNSTDLAVTNGWMLSMSTTAGITTSPSIMNINFKGYDSAGAQRNATVAIPAGYAVGSRPIAIVATWADGADALLYVNGQQMDTVAVVGAIVPGTSRLAIGSMPGASGANSNEVSVMSAAYAPETISALNASLLIQQMLETGELLTQPDFELAPTWTHHYSMQQSEVRTLTTLPYAKSAVLQTADLTDVTIANLGTTGASGNLVAFGSPAALVQVCPLAIGNG